MVRAGITFGGHTSLHVLHERFLTGLSRDIRVISLIRLFARMLELLGKIKFSWIIMYNIAELRLLSSIFRIKFGAS